MAVFKFENSFLSVRKYWLVKVYEYKTNKVLRTNSRWLEIPKSQGAESSNDFELDADESCKPYGKKNL